MRVAVDISPLLHTTTSGTATYLLELTEHLPLIAPGDEFVWFYQAPWRSGRRRPPPEWRPSAPLVVPRVPPRLIEAAWRHFSRPSVRYLARKPDVFHASHIWQPPLGNARGVMTIHDLTPVIMPEAHVAGNVEAYRQVLDYAIERAAGILVDSESTRHDLLSVAPWVESRTRVVPLAAAREFTPVADSSELHQALSTFGLSHQRYFLFAGVSEPRKNVRRLLAAFAALDQPSVEDIRLVIAGPPGWGDLSASEEATRLGVEDRVTVTGGLSRQMLRYLMAGALSFVYPSLYEGFGIPPLEAMSCGTPVITSNVSSLPEVVGEAAILVDPLRVDEIAGAMSRLIENPDLRVDLQRRGLARAKQFSWENTARETADFYHWVAACA